MSIFPTTFMYDCLNFLKMKTRWLASIIVREAAKGFWIWFWIGKPIREPQRHKVLWRWRPKTEFTRWPTAAIVSNALPLGRAGRKNGSSTHSCWSAPEGASAPPLSCRSGNMQHEMQKSTPASSDPPATVPRKWKRALRNNFLWILNENAIVKAFCKMLDILFRSRVKLWLCIKWAVSKESSGLFLNGS